MRIGFLTNAFVWAGESRLENIARFAADNGFAFLEVGPGIPLNTTLFRNAQQIVDIDALIFCRNFIDDDPEVRERFRKELFKRMEFASEIGAKRIICSTGISRKLSLPASGGCNPLLSLDPAAGFLDIAVRRADQLGIQVCLENCPMYRNIATSPLMWRAIFGKVPSPTLGICYDAAHFVWQMIDVYGPIAAFADRIHHLHIKDTAVDTAKLNDVGILHNTGTEKGHEENQWWTHLIAGDGDIDWPRFLSLTEQYLEPEIDMSIEMEDYRYEGDPEKIRQGMLIQRDRLMNGFREQQRQ